MPELRRSTGRDTGAANKPSAKKRRTDTLAKVSKTEPKKPEDEKKATRKSEEPEKLKEVEEGDEIPDLTLFDENQNEVPLKEIAAKSKYLVIFAYPRASTPGCTRQACGFQSNYADFKDLNAQVFGLSADSPKAQLNFVTKQGLKYPLLSDPQRKLITALGAKKAPSGIKRSHWIFENGRLRSKEIQISPEVSVSSALKYVQELNESKK